VSWTLGNDEWLYVNSVRLATGTGFHHSNWFWVPETSYAGADGTWRCSDRGYDEALAAAMGGVLFAQSTQAVDETQAFPEGVVIAIPPHAKVVAGIHLLNASDEPLTTPLSLTLTPIALADVTTRLAALSLTYEAIEIPPNRTASFTVDCPLGQRFLDVIGGPLDLKVYYALPHYHDLGRRIEIVASGPGGDRTVFETMSAIGEPAGRALTPGVRSHRHRVAALLVHVPERSRQHRALGRRRSGDVRDAGVHRRPVQLGRRRAPPQQPRHARRRRRRAPLQPAVRALRPPRPPGAVAGTETGTETETETETGTGTGTGTEQVETPLAFRTC
jgi:hypothetical protein